MGYLRRLLGADGLATLVSPAVIACPENPVCHELSLDCFTGPIPSEHLSHALFTPKIPLCHHPLCRAEKSYACSKQNDRYPMAQVEPLSFAWSSPLSYPAASHCGPIFQSLGLCERATRVPAIIHACILGCSGC